MPVVGLLGTTAVGRQPGDGFVAVRQGLAEQGFVVGANVVFDLRGAQGHIDQLPAMAADLVRRGVAVLMTGGNEAALAAKSATATIPIVFTVGDDPTEIGLVPSLARPGGNATGVSVFGPELAERRLQILRELVPNVMTVASVTGAMPLSSWKESIETAANNLKLKVITFQVDSVDDFEPVFASAARSGARGLLVGAGRFLIRYRAQIVALASRYRLPTIYPWQEFAEMGGLVSYGPDVYEAYTQAGRYAGRILKGASPGDLPVQLPTKFRMVINLKAAETLGLTLPRSLIARADKVIY
ncbi:MAG TPA: ABC transporter substrate-binding protein [Xanthobacteraceae bacterium]|nr:ABC transporter substrate-binding protein [Xanthobacteraceae bacterium]